MLWVASPYSKRGVNDNHYSQINVTGRAALAPGLMQIGQRVVRGDVMQLTGEPGAVGDVNRGRHDGRHLLGPDGGAGQ